MDVIEAFALTGYVLLTGVAALSGRVVMPRKFEDMNQNRLIRLNFFATKIMRIAIVVALLGPIPLCFLIPHLPGAPIRKIVIGFIIFIESSAVALFWAFWRVESVTKTLMTARLGDRNVKGAGPTLQITKSNYDETTSP